MSNKGPREIGPTDDGNGTKHDAKQKTSERRSLDASRGEITNTSELSDPDKPRISPTHKLEGTTTRNLGDTSESEFSKPEWRQKQLAVMADYWRKTGQLGDGKRKADELDLDPSSPTKELRTEATHTLGDTPQIVEVSNDENQPPDALSRAKKIENRRQLGHMLPTDQASRVLSPTNRNNILFPR